MARLETDITLLLTSLSLVSHLTAQVAFDVRTVFTPMTPLFAAETKVLGTVACVMGIDFVADFAL